MLVILLLSLLCWSAVSGGFGPGTQEHGYVTVREGAHMFWWLYQAQPSDFQQRPLILWLSGGPGGSSCGYGNFMGVGPWDEEKIERPHTWVKDYNVLFVDSPVGAGFSYVDHLKYLADDNEEIARDLYELLKGFYNAVPRYKPNKLYIYGDGYGGKMAVDFANLLHIEVLNKTIDANLVGIALSNAFISGIHAVSALPTFLYQTGFIDNIGKEELEEQVEFLELKFEEGDKYHTTLEFTRTINMIQRLTDGLDFGNIVTKIINLSTNPERTFQESVFDSLTYSKYYNNRTAALDTLMNTEVKSALNISEHVIWGGQAINTFENLFDDIMNPVVNKLEVILNTTNIAVHIVNCNFAIIVDTPGQLDWINQMEWINGLEYHESERTTIWVNGTMEGYKKGKNKFYFYWLKNAGENYVNENHEAIEEILKDMTAADK